MMERDFNRIVRLVLAAVLLTVSLSGYLGWKLGVIEGRQAGAAVACEPIVNELAKPGIKAVP